jgi:hypothetical protein
MFQYSPIRSPMPEDRRALLKVMDQQLKAYRSGLPLMPLAPTKPGAAKEIELKYQVWGMQYASRSTDVLSSYTQIADLFQQDGIEGRILILGEPGMGKTHTLLAVGQILQQRARQSDGPVPVLIDLSGWQGEPLRTWLIDYLWETYRIAKPIAEDWIDVPQLTLLLDGFDHLPTAQQRSCAYAIDTLLRTSPEQTAMLCCRRKVLEETGITFNHFNSGVNIIPLAAQQVKDYTTALNRPDLWQGIKGNKTLQVLARVPLHLHLLGVMYQGQPIASRAALIDTFITHQLAQGNIAPQPDQTALRWLAQELEQRSRTFRLDQLQKSWLPFSRRLLYRLLIVVLLALTYGLIGGNLVLGLALGLVASQIDVEDFPRHRLSLATASWQGLGVMALVSGGAALAGGLLLGVLAALLLVGFGGALPAFGMGSCLGAILGWCLALGVLLWGGLQNSMQLRHSPNQDVVYGLRNATVLVGLLGGIIALFLILPSVLANQPVLTLFNGQRIRLLVVGCLGAILWLSFGLQQAVLRILLLPSKGTGGLPFAERSWLRRSVASGLLRPVGDGFRFCHNSVRLALAQDAPEPTTVAVPPHQQTAPTR